MKPVEARLAGAMILLVGIALLGWQGYEGSRGSGITFLAGRGLPIPVDVPGVILVLIGAWRVVFPFGLRTSTKMSLSSLLIDVGAIVIPLGILSLISFESAGGLRWGIVTGGALGILFTIWFSTSKAIDKGAFCGGMLLVVLPSGLIGGGLGALIDHRSSTAVVFVLIGGIIGFPCLAFLVVSFFSRLDLFGR